MKLRRMLLIGGSTKRKAAKPKKQRKSLSQSLLDGVGAAALKALEGKWNNDLWDQRI